MMYKQFMKFIKWVSKILWGDEELHEDSKMILKSRDLGDGKFEVGGVVFYCDTHAEAIKKYRRGSNEQESGKS